MQKRKSSVGFTLIELIVVLAVMAILMLMAVPSYDSKYVRPQVVESIELIKPLKDSVALFYIGQQKFPRNNIEAGVPQADFLKGNYVRSIAVENGAFQITFGHKINANLNNKILSIRPMVVIDSPESPISWVCGNSPVPAGMVAVGANRTDIPVKYLPLNCF